MPGEEDPQFIRKGNAVIRYAYGQDPDTLSDSEWARLIQEWRFMRHIELNGFEERMRIVLYDLANAIYGKR